MYNSQEATEKQKEEIKCFGETYAVIDVAQSETLNKNKDKKESLDVKNTGGESNGR